MSVAGFDRSMRRARLGLPFVLAMSLVTHPAALAARQAAPQAAQPPARVATLPARLTDAAFWKLVSDISEPGGYFRIEDNYTSNEREVGPVFTMLRQANITGGVYIGVGPEQNFSYMAATRPAMAFIIDIRRQAVVQHLMYKAVFELSKDRGDFLSLLFSTPRPAGIDAATPIQRIWDVFLPLAPEMNEAPKTYARIVTHLTKTHGFTLTTDESAQLRAVWEAFSLWGPGISTRGAPGGGGRGGGGRGFGGGNGATFADLTGYSMDALGQVQSFLSTEDHYRYIKSLHERNLIVPVSGDFGGPRALRGIGAYVSAHGATVSAFYVSNVEQYLFQDGKDRAFYDNVATLPVTAQSVFIRPYSLRSRGGGSAAQSLCPIASFIGAVRAGRVYSNNDALACGR